MWCALKAAAHESKVKCELLWAPLRGTRFLSVCCLLSRFSRVRLCDPLDCSPPSSSVHGILQERVGVGCHALLQGIFPTQGSTLISYNPCIGKWVLFFF